MTFKNLNLESAHNISFLNFVYPMFAKSELYLDYPSN